MSDLMKDPAFRGLVASISCALECDALHSRYVLESLLNKPGAKERYDAGMAKMKKAGEALEAALDEGRRTGTLPDPKIPPLEGP